jgi:hypothetical protein
MAALFILFLGPPADAGVIFDIISLRNAKSGIEYNTKREMIGCWIW